MILKHHPQLAFEPLQVQDAWQSQAVKELLSYLQAHSPFYQKLFKEHHIDIGNIHSIHDLSFLPTTTKADMQEHNWEFLCVESQKIREYTATSGTMGRPVTVALTEND